MIGLCCPQRPREGWEPLWEDPHEFMRPLSWVDVSNHNAPSTSEEDPKSPSAARGLRKAIVGPLTLEEQACLVYHTDC